MKKNLESKIKEMRLHHQRSSKFPVHDHGCSASPFSTMTGSSSSPGGRSSLYSFGIRTTLFVSLWTALSVVGYALNFNASTDAMTVSLLPDRVEVGSQQPIIRQSETHEDIGNDQSRLPTRIEGPIHPIQHQTVTPEVKRNWSSLPGRPEMASQPMQEQTGTTDVKRTESIINSAAAVLKPLSPSLFNLSTFDQVKPLDLPQPPVNITFHQNTTLNNHNMQYLTPLRSIDKKFYTIRLNTYQRHAQLAQSIASHASCPGVAQIIVIWSERTVKPPAWIVSISDKVVFEYHVVNSLNERFNMLQPAPTLGIMSIDDDVLRPCEAIESAFVQWTLSPDKIVGFDARGYVVKNGELFYRRELERGYSMALTRYCFIHRDYLHWYENALPRVVYDKVQTMMNCEDLAMSLFMTALSGGDLPLLADSWARWTEVTLESDNAISESKRHKMKRMVCINLFSEILGLKTPSGVLLNSTLALPWNESFVDHLTNDDSNNADDARLQAAKSYRESIRQLELRDIRVKMKVLSVAVRKASERRMAEWKEQGFL